MNILTRSLGTMRLATTTHMDRDSSLRDCRSLTYKFVPTLLLLLLVAYITCTLIYSINLQKQIPERTVDI